MERQAQLLPESRPIRMYCTQVVWLKASALYVLKSGGELQTPDQPEHPHCWLMTSRRVRLF